MSWHRFSDDDGKAKQKYKLWVLYKPPLCFKVTKNPMVYFGFGKKKDAGLKGLLKLAEDRKSEYYMAILYDNQTREEIRRWESEAIPPHIKTLITKRQSTLMSYVRQKE